MSPDRTAMMVQDWPSSEKMAAQKRPPTTHSGGATHVAGTGVAPLHVLVRVDDQAAAAEAAQQRGGGEHPATESVSGEKMVGRTHQNDPRSVAPAPIGLA